MYGGGLMWLRLLIVAAAGCAIFAVGWLLYEGGKKEGRLEVQQMWDQNRADIAEAITEETMRARQRESALQELANRLRQEKVDEARRLAREYAADIERLRNRPETRAGAGGVPEGASPGVGCTGEGLSRRDAEFLIGLAADAARTQSALKQCVSAYNSVRAQLPSPRD